MSDDESDPRLVDRLPVSEQRFSLIKSGMDEAVPIVLLLFGLLIVFQFLIPVTPELKALIHYAAWGVAIFFLIRLAVDYRLHDSDESFWRTHWSDLLMAIPLFTILQEARLAAYLERVLGASQLRNEIAAVSILRDSRAASKIAKIIQILRRTVRL